MHVTAGPRENGFRPAVDPLFRSAAQAYGPRVIGVILSGMLDDGTAGLLSVKRHGGVALVQDPGEALAPGMPRSALAYVAVDETLPVAAMGPALGRLAAKLARGAEGRETVPDDTTQGASTGEGTRHGAATASGAPTRFSCPECHGVLSELYDGELLRFACQVGHRFSPQSLAADQAATVEQTLWAALAALNERALLLRRLAREARGQADASATRRFEAGAHLAEAQREQVRRVLSALTGATGDTGGDPREQDTA
jgi:two-component system chemotaxis response regulator CheB